MDSSVDGKTDVNGKICVYSHTLSEWLPLDTTTGSVSNEGEWLEEVFEGGGVVEVLVLRFR